MPESAHRSNTPASPATPGVADRAETATGADWLSAALMPVLLHEVANVTQTLTGLNSILTMDGGNRLFAERSEDLVRSGRAAEDLGWAMAVLGTAGGSDLLLARREPRGLSILLRLVYQACRREDLEVHPPAPDLPHLAPACLDGWQLPWALGSLLLNSARGGGGDWNLNAAPAASTPSWTFTWGSGSSCGARETAIVQQLPGAQLVATPEGPHQLHLPSDWLFPAK